MAIETGGWGLEMTSGAERLEGGLIIPADTDETGSGCQEVEEKQSGV